MPKLYAHAFHRLGHRADAEDVAQEAFLRLCNIAPNWKQDQAQVTTWLYRVVINLCQDWHRRKTPQDLASVHEPEDTARSPAEQMDEQYRHSALYAAIWDLPDRQRLAVQLRHIDELSNPEIAEIMELSIEAVESLIARGKRKITEILQSQKPELGYSHG